MLSALLVALPLLVAGGSPGEAPERATVARGTERPPLSGAIDGRRLSGLDLPIVVRDGVRTIANVDGSLPRPRLATLFVPTVPDDGPQGIPATALAAYRNAAEGMGNKQPGCNLHWALLAGIGRIESNHAYGGYVDEHGTTIEPILGPVLDGSGNTAAIPDTDDGKYDGNATWDRAVGPMQFIPSTWRQYASDGNGDGVADPHNIYDATLAAGRYLCFGGLDLSDREQLRTAVYRYNHSASYVEEVLAWAESYREGVTELPDSDVPVAVPKIAAKSAPEPVRFVSSGESAGDAGDTGDSGDRKQARDSRAEPDPDSRQPRSESGGSTLTTHPSTRMTATSTRTTTTTSTGSSLSPTTSTSTTTSTTTTSTTATTTTSSTSTTTPTTTTSTSQRCDREAEPTSSTAPSSTTTTSSSKPSAATRDDACGTETSEPSTTSTSPTPSP